VRPRRAYDLIKAALWAHYDLQRSAPCAKTNLPLRHCIGRHILV